VHWERGGVSMPDGAHGGKRAKTSLCRSAVVIRQMTDAFPDRTSARIPCYPQAARDQSDPVWMTGLHKPASNKCRQTIQHGIPSFLGLADGREIATLRAIGFGPGPVVLSVLAEGMILAIPAALVGADIAWFLFNGHVVVPAGLTFHMTVAARLVLVSLCWAISIAAIGGLLPAIRAARLPVATGLRAA